MVEERGRKGVEALGEGGGGRVTAGAREEPR
jgi:hypothetical protein